MRAGIVVTDLCLVSAQPMLEELVTPHEAKYIGPVLKLTEEERGAVAVGEPDYATLRSEFSGSNFIGLVLKRRGVRRPRAAGCGLGWAFRGVV